MRVVVRSPHGVKQGIDFDRVHTELIGPALAAIGLPTDQSPDGGQANIVVADVSLDPQGVLSATGAYRVVSISASRPGSTSTGELSCSYNPGNPSAAVESLVTILREARSFVEEAEHASAECGIAHLRLLASEVRDFPWAKSALEVLSQRLAVCEKLRDAPTYKRAIVFTGHMVDAPTRPKARFPGDKETEASLAISNALGEFAEGEPAACVGIAGGASGGDILFHEACQNLGIPARLRLAMPAQSFAKRSVSPSGGDWMQRFTHLTGRLHSSTEVLCSGDDLPVWLQAKTGYNVWGRANLWMLEDAAASAPDVRLLALWNHARSDGPGGTGHFIEEVRRRGISTQVLDTRKLFGF